MITEDILSALPPDERERLSNASVAERELAARLIAEAYVAFEMNREGLFRRIMPPVLVGDGK